MKKKVLTKPQTGLLKQWSKDVMNTKNTLIKYTMIHKNLKDTTNSTKFVITIKSMKNNPFILSDY